MAGHDFGKHRFDQACRAEEQQAKEKLQKNVVCVLHSQRSSLLITKHDDEEGNQKNRLYEPRDWFLQDRQGFFSGSIQAIGSTYYNQQATLSVDAFFLVTGELCR